MGRSASAMRLWAAGLFLALFAAVAWAQVAVPELSRRVTDLTATLSAGQVAALENRLAEFEARRGSQIAILIIPTVQPEDIAQFGIRVADQWKIGRKKIDDGVILIVAKNDRKLRIEVGYGLEGVIPDAIAKRVIAETITPYFKAGDFHGGIEAGMEQLIGLIEGESLPPPASAQSSKPGGDNVLIFMVMGYFLGSFFSSMMGRGIAGGLSGLGVTGLSWLVSGAVLSSVLMGAGVFAAVLLLGGLGRGWGGGGGGGWSSGGGRLGGGSSWGGGGGGFGGGGASGSW